MRGIHADRVVQLFAPGEDVLCSVDGGMAEFLAVCQPSVDTSIVFPPCDHRAAAGGRFSCIGPAVLLGCRWLDGRLFCDDARQFYRGSVGFVPPVCAHSHAVQLTHMGCPALPMGMACDSAFRFALRDASFIDPAANPDISS